MSNPANIESLLPPRRRRLHNDFRRRTAHRAYQIIPWSELVRDQARILARNVRTGVPHPGRALDAIQLASCLYERKAATALGIPLTMLCSDPHALDLARAEGLVVVNPEQMPPP